MMGLIASQVAVKSIRLNEISGQGRRVRAYSLSCYISLDVDVIADLLEISTRDRDLGGPQT